jgi:Protein of unknown function (DUF3303)
MHFMVIERVRGGDYRAVGERFRQRGRMMPPGVEYVASWLVPTGEVCYQVMQASSREALQPWMDAWIDLVVFEVIEVEPSAVFWARANADTERLASSADPAWP